eukprot:g17385.t1
MTDARTELLRHRAEKYRKELEELRTHMLEREREYEKTSQELSNLAQEYLVDYEKEKQKNSLEKEKRIALEAAQQDMWKMVLNTRKERDEYKKLLEEAQAAAQN